MLITDQVATAPCTDPIQVRIKTFGAKPLLDLIQDLRIPGTTLTMQRK